MHQQFCIWVSYYIFLSVHCFPVCLLFLLSHWLTCFSFATISIALGNSLHLIIPHAKSYLSKYWICIFFYFKDLPEIARYPFTSPIIEGGNTTLVCQASGNPRPNITWTKRGSNKTLSYSDGLFLSNLTRFDDKTEYECKAMNYLGFVEASVSVTIHCKWMWYRFLLLYKLYVQWIFLSYCCKFMVSVYLHSVVPKEKKWLFGCFCFDKGIHFLLIIMYSWNVWF